MKTINNFLSTKFNTRLFVAFITLLAAMTLMGAQASAQNVNVAGSTGANGTYPTLGAAFTALNANTNQTGNTITVSIVGDTNELAATATLNQPSGGSWTSLTITPTGTRTVTGATTAGSPLIDFNGADSVTINGLNTGGNSLTISNTTASATSGTSTIRFIGGATGNTITNTTVLGSASMALGTNGGTIFFSTDGVTANGNDNNTVSFCNLGPAGANLPTKAIYGNGSTTTAAIRNSGIIIDNNNIFDVFNAAVSVSSIHILSGNDSWTISNNKIYQTASRTFTTTNLRYAGITINSTAGTLGAFTITANRIGFGAANGTGTTTLSGLANLFRGLDLISVNATTPTSVQGNVISGINQTTSATTGSTTAGFIAIMLGTTGGRFNVGDVTGNTVGSLDGSSTIVINATSTTANTGTEKGIYDFSVSSNVISNNNIGAITINSGGTGTAAGFRGIQVNTGSTNTVTITNNTIGGTGAGGSITDNIVGSYSMYAIENDLASPTITGNTIRNMAGNSTGASLIISSGIIDVGTGTAGHNVSQNTIHSLSNNSGAASNSIYALYASLPTTGTNIVARNFIHSLSITSSTATSQLVGIVAAAGNANYQNNIVRIGIDAAGSSVGLDLQLYGIFEIAGTNNFSYNSSYVGGSPAVSTQTTFAFVSNVVTNARNYRDNIFWNARSNGSGAGKNYAIAVGGTGVNPAGLTSNFNDLYATGTSSFVGLYNATDQLTLANWQAATGQDANSISADPQFRNVTGDATNVDLHLQASSPAVGAGTPIAGITNDFDNDPRPASNPDIGADEVVMGGGGSVPAGTYFNVSTADGDTLAGDVIVTNQLTLGGKLNTGSFTLTLDCNATITGAGGGNYVVGNLKKNYCSTGSFVFAVGTNGANPGYSPVTVNATALGVNPSSLTIIAKDGPQPNVDASKSIQRYWTLTETGDLTADMTFQYLLADVMGNETLYKVIRVSGGTPSGIPTSTVNTVNHTGTVTGVSNFSDWTVGEIAAPTAAPVSISGLVTDAFGQPLGGVVLNLSGANSARVITDGTGKYRFDNLETNGFYTVTPEMTNFNFNPSSRTYSLNADRADASFTGAVNAIPVGNPLDTGLFFVRQNYLDFLGREPDVDGLNYWTSQLELCASDLSCLRSRRLDVSAAFFKESEFQDSGSFIYRLYKGALGRQTNYAEFSTDRKGVVGGANLEQSKVAFADSFVQRAEFINKYSSAQTAESFVSTVIETMRQSAGVDLSGQYSTLVEKYRTGTSVNASRSLVVREAIEAGAFKDAVYNQSFVLMEYYGYLKRDPDEEGYNFWVNVLNTREPNNYRGMVCSFVTSAEYQKRFSSVATHSNAECGH